MEKIKVAVVIPTHSNINSSLANLLKVYECLKEKYNVDVTIFTDRKNNFHYKNFKAQKINGVDYKTIFEKILLFFGLQRFYYIDLVEKLEGYDIIETSNPEFYWFAYQSYIAAKKYNSRLVYRTSQTVDGFYLFKLTKFIPLAIAKKAYSYAKWLLFSNPEAAERCVRLGLVEKNSKNIIVTGHPTDIKTFRPLRIKRSNKIVLLSVGGLYRIKGHHIIIKSLKILVDKGYNAELWIVGEGYYKKTLVDLAKNLNIQDKVKFLGQKSHSELAKIYNMSSIFVLANYQEITPAVNEAMACQKPVVAMECGGFMFIIPNKNYGLVSKKFDERDMADKMLCLIKNKRLADRIAKNGRNHILNNFSIENVAKKFYKSFTE